MEIISNVFAFTFMAFLNILLGGGIFYTIFSKGHEIQSEIDRHEHMINLKIELLTKKIVSIESKNDLH